MPEAARVSDPIAHSGALAGLLTGLAVGALVGVAALAIVTTGPIGAVAVIVAASTGASIGGMIGEWIGSKFTVVSGYISEDCSPSVTCNGLRAARVLDLVNCSNHAAMPIAHGSRTVWFNSFPAARVGDKITCGGELSAGSANVIIGGGQEIYLEIYEEVPAWARWLEFGVGLPSLIAGVWGLGLKLIQRASVLRVSPRLLRWTQRSAGGGGRAAILRDSLRKFGWRGKPIDVVRTSEGLVTVDHTRAAVAMELGIDTIPVRVHLPSSPLPPSMAGRFGSARTWGEAIAHRAAMQRPPLPPTGTTVPPRLPP
jgi:uncharacterized Zn-binding protein involved in type VI secretion